MNIAEAKKIPIMDVFHKLGAEEDINRRKPDGSETWFKALDRQEEKASVHVFPYKGFWQDFGSGKKGDVIDLVRHVMGGSVSEALQWLKGFEGQVTPENIKRAASVSPTGERAPIKKFAKEKEKEFDQRTVAGRNLINYMGERGIPKDLLNKHCREIHFKTGQGKRLYGVGFQNDSGGWAVRMGVGDFKAVIEPNDMTTIYSREQTRVVDVLEGFSDYLTKEQTQPQQPDESIIVLNTASFAGAGIDKILSDPRFANVQLVRTWFDNDTAGDTATHEYAEKLHQKCDVGDVRPNYAGYKDLNKWWTDCPTARHGSKQEMRYSSDTPKPVHKHMPPNPAGM